MSEEVMKAAPERSFDVFVSYAHEDSTTVQRILKAIVELGLTIFDPFQNKEQMWGVDLNAWFSNIFPAQAKAALIFLSKDYSSSNWCTKELNYILRSASEHPTSAKVLPIALDESPIPEVATNLVFLSFSKTSPKEIALLTKEKVIEIEEQDLDLALLADEELIERVAFERDRNAFDILYKRIYPVIMRHVRSYSKRVAEDDRPDYLQNVLEDVVVDVWEQATKFRKDEMSFDEWLAHLTRAATVGFTRERARTHAKEILVPTVPGSAWPPFQDKESSRTLETSIELAEVMEQMDRELSQPEFSAKDRKVFQLWLQGMTNSEIATVLSISDSLARYELQKIMVRVRYQIRRRMKESGRSTSLTKEETKEESSVRRSP